MSSISVPLSKLVLSPRNVRQTGASADTSDLEPTLLEHGQLQALVAHPMARGRFGVTAGGRRLLAFQRLAAAGAIGKDHGIDVVVRDEDDATLTELSIVENTARVALPPAEEFAAFRRLADQGKDVAEIARRFATTELHVRQRMRLGQLHPDILAALNAGRITLEAAQAYAATTDQTLQKRVFDLNRQAHAYEVRAALKRDAVNAGVDRMLALVGMEAYAAAGGRAEEDLFHHGEPRVLDLDLLRELYAAKLDGEKAALALPAGATVQFDHAGVGARIEPAAELSDTDAERLQAIDTRCDAISDRLEAIADWDQDGPADRLVADPGQSQDEVDNLLAELKRLEAESEGLRDAAELAGEEAIAGPVIAVTAVRDGRLQVTGLHRPLGWRPEGESAGAPPAFNREPAAPAPSGKDEHGLSKDALEVMRSHRRQILAGALVAHAAGERLAGKLVAFVLARGMLAGAAVRSDARSLGVDSLPRHDYDPPHARDDLAAQPGAAAQREAIDALRAAPWMTEPDPAEAFRRFAHTPGAERQALACLATAMLSRTLGLPGLDAPIHGVVAELLNLYPRDLWAPDARFFAWLSKGRTLDALREVDPALAKRLAGLGKKDLAEAAAAIMSASPESCDRYGLTAAAVARARAWVPDYLAFAAPADIEADPAREPTAAE